MANDTNSRLAVIETKMETLNESVSDVKVDIKSVNTLIQEFINAANEKFAQNKRVEDLEKKVAVQGKYITYATGFAAAVVAGIELGFRIFGK